MSSVLKGMKPRESGNIPTKETYNSNEPLKATKKEKHAETKYQNQSHQIKISAQLKEEINALKAITNTKFDYEVLSLLIDSYNKNEFDPTQRRRFRALTSDDF